MRRLPRPRSKTEERIEAIGGPIRFAPGINNFREQAVILRMLLKLQLDKAHVVTDGGIHKPTSDPVRLAIFGSFCKVLIAKFGDSKPVCSGLALIDTGCQNSNLDKKIVNEFGITAHDRQRAVVSSTQKDAFGTTIDFRIAIPEMGGLYFDISEGMVSDTLFEATGAIVLLGRDVLSHLKLTFDGPKGEAFLEYEPPSDVEQFIKM